MPNSTPRLLLPSKFVLREGFCSFHSGCVSCHLYARCNARQIESITHLPCFDNYFEVLALISDLHLSPYADFNVPTPPLFEGIQQVISFD